LVSLLFHCLLRSFEACKKAFGTGDIAVNKVDNPQTIKVHLKKSKTNQLGKGVDVCIRKTGCFLCPVVAIMHYISIWGENSGPFFCSKEWKSFDQVVIHC